MFNVQGLFNQSLGFVSVINRTQKIVFLLLRKGLCEIQGRLHFSNLPHVDDSLPVLVLEQLRVSVLVAGLLVSVQLQQVGERSLALAKPTEIQPKAEYKLEQFKSFRSCSINIFALKTNK